MTVRARPQTAGAEERIFTAEIAELGKLMLHHQCWFFGRDIHHPAGNLLIRYGFERCGVPDGAPGSNCYRLRRAAAVEINLWGWGVFYGAAGRGAIFIKRYDFNPRYCGATRLPRPVFQLERLPAELGRPRPGRQIEAARRLTLDLIDWIADYERWIAGNCGAKWRRQCLREWPNASLVNGAFKKNWRLLRERLAGSFE